MKTFESLQHWIQYRDEALTKGLRFGFVPTMGALHHGHRALIQKAAAENDLSVVSIFVNPTQFNQKEDFEKYPKDLAADIEMLKSLGVDVLITPKENEIYNDRKTMFIEESEESRILCGAHRPGHFAGVLTIMMKLLNLAKAKNCYMGEKDYQQFHLIKKLSESFFIDTQIIGVPTVREPNGLALSSRNVRLSEQGRVTASLIYRLLSSEKNLNSIRTQLEKSGFNVEYVESHWGRTFVAAWLEGVRLIDNV